MCLEYPKHMFCRIFMTKKPLLSGSKHGYLRGEVVLAVSMQSAFFGVCYSELFSTSCQMTRVQVPQLSCACFAVQISFAVRMDFKGTPCNYAE